MEYEIIVQSPDQISESEFGDFIAFILAGDEVERGNLEDRVRKAEQLIFLRVAGCLAGIGALKNPNARYRRHVASEAGTDLTPTEYPFELGWIFVLSSYRGRGYANRIAEAALTAAKGAGIFSTSRSDNDATKKILEKQGFLSTGKPYVSQRRNFKLQLFVRGASQQCTPTDARTLRS